MLYLSGFELYSRWVPLKIGKPWTMRNFYLISHPDLMIKMPSGNRIYGYPSFPAVRVREMKKRGVLFFFFPWIEGKIHSYLQPTCGETLGTLDLKNLKLRQSYFLIFLSLLLLLICKSLGNWSLLPTPPKSHKVVRNLNPCVIKNAKLLSVTQI